MVSAMDGDSGASGPGSSPGRGHCAVFLGKTRQELHASPHLEHIPILSYPYISIYRTFTLTVPQSTKVYTCVPANVGG